MKYLHILKLYLKNKVKYLLKNKLNETKKKTVGFKMTKII